MDPSLRRRLERGAERLGVMLAPEALAAFDRYLDLLALWNRRINLTAIRDPVQVVEKHFVDSLAVVPHVSPGARLVDAGSGGGFPGAVVALVRPDVAVTLVEPIHKKTAFLEALRRELPLSSARVRTGRIEDVEQAGERFDVAVSRATWDLDEWLERGARLVVPGGKVLGMEGADEHVLPPDAVRHPYELDGARRAIVVRSVLAS